MNNLIFVAALLFSNVQSFNLQSDYSCFEKHAENEIIITIDNNDFNDDMELS